MAKPTAAEARSLRQFGALLLGALTVLIPDAGFAQTLPTVVTGSECPERSVLEPALSARKLPPETASFRLTTAPVAAGVFVTLEDSTGTVRVSRTLESNDCVALADAIALIVETYFSDLALRAERERVKQVDVAPKPAPPPKLAPTAASSAPNGGSTRFGLLVEVGPELVGSNQSGGAEVVLAGAVAASLRWPRSGLVGRVHLQSSTPSTVSMGSDEVSRWASRVSLRAGLQRPSSAGPRAPRLDVLIGAGISVSRLEFSGAATNPVEVSFSPVLESALGLELPSGGPFSGRGELGCAFQLLQESYQLSPDGEIGTGPRYSCAVLLGVAWESRGNFQ